MHDQPPATEHEQEQGPERQREEDAMRYPGHDDPHGVTEPGASGGEEQEE